ncbi:PP2C family serine/threonine-protein phosphatase [Wukongibacter baidiensis]|uniref:PP2C family protein-serine/threonine phosphatase n=1 Tax=Wukongibacter baidiensis TaxID=1723361 RepID=UPI003D7F44C3
MRKRGFSIGALSEIGYVKKTNQDRILIKIGEEAHGEFGLFVVADGMGGLAAGDKASEIVIGEFKNWWNTRLSIILNNGKKNSISIIDKELDNLVFKINEKIIKFSQEINCRVGTTLSMLFIFKNKFIIKHVGDSRIYKINKKMIKLTEDHSWVAEQVRQGIMSERDAVNHPKSHVLLQCIGVKERIELFRRTGEVLEEDVFLLCSDGFYNLLLKNEILDAVEEYKENDEDIQNKVEKLMEKVKTRGAVDNASAILVYQNYDETKIGVLEKLKDLIG